MSPEPSFRVGINLPWLQYGCDFGANRWQPEGGVSSPDRRRRLDAAMARLAGHNLRLVRWFLLCDGRAGVRFGPDGLAVGFDGCFWRDLEAGVETAARHGLSLVLVLFDFGWWRRRRSVNGVVCGGHRAATGPGPRRHALFERVVAPLLDRCGRERAIVAWDIVNEPEWATLGYGATDPRTAVLPSAMRGFLGECAALVRAHTRQAATVGLASWCGLRLVRGMDVDFYQVHWYDHLDWRAPLESPMAAALDRPVWLGEFPTAGSSRTPAEILESARRAGYAAALGWSAESQDRWSSVDGLTKASW